jgi:hypothetical protein
MADDGRSLAIYDDHQKRAGSADINEDLVEAVVCVSVDAMDVSDARDAARNGVDIIDIRPDIDHRGCLRCHVLHSSCEACLKFLRGQETGSGHPGGVKPSANQRHVR